MKKRKDFVENSSSFKDLCCCIGAKGLATNIRFHKTVKPEKKKELRQSIAEKSLRVVG